MILSVRVLILGQWAIASALAAPAATSIPALAAPTVTITHPQATIVGSTSSPVESFIAIPFARPPVKNLRLRPPQPLTTPLGTIRATGSQTSCPQLTTGSSFQFPDSTLSVITDNPFFQNITNAGEDCLTLSIYRPSTAKSTSKLPVLFWIYGGAFEFGGASTYDGTNLVETSINRNEDMIYVAINYRLGGFGFLGGQAIMDEGASNLGLLDQRLALQWVAQNIAAFGGDPDKVTIWGESAGSISVLDQMVLYNGDNTFHGKPLFRGAIMDSGSITGADPVNCPKAEVVYSTVLTNSPCNATTGAASLTCLRGLDYQTFLNAVSSVPSAISYQSIALAYLPRPDGKVLTKSPDILVKQGKYARVPFIIGDQEDEGTIFALSQENITTSAELLTYIKTYFFNNASPAQLRELLAAYPDNPAKGSPFGTGDLNQLYPQYKRLAALLGDFAFIMTRRFLLTLEASVSPAVATWSYLASYDNVVPFLGTFHASDILPAYGITPGFSTTSIQSYYIAFVNHLNPNTAGQRNWPEWRKEHQLLHFGAVANGLLNDTFREAGFELIGKLGPALYI